MLPHTTERPKPLVKLGQYSILEVILRRLRAAEFQRVTLCISHLGEMVRSEFGDGRHLGLAIDYCLDADGPLGTAAPLLMVQDWDMPAVVMNGDVLATIDFADLYRRHLDGRSLLTVAYHQRRLSAGVGVLQVLGERVQAIWEKPEFEWNISSGINVASPLVRRYIPAGRPFDMPSLITALIEHGETVNGYGFSGAWHDIGTPARYEQAKAEFLADPDLYLKPVPAGGQPGASRMDISVLFERNGDDAMIETGA